MDDADAYLDIFNDLLDTIKVKAYVIELDMEEIILLMRNFKLSTADAIHMAWADYNYDYFVTCDNGLLALAPQFKRPKIMLPSALHTIVRLRRKTSLSRGA